MNENTVIAIIVAQAVVLLCLFFQQFALNAKVSRLLHVISQRLPSDEQKILQARAIEQRDTSGEFEQFLKQHPHVATLAKKEQAAAFRDWRKSQGKTWH